MTPEVATESGGAATRTRVRLTEIFCSLQGESASVGWPTVFVRLTGCPLRCHYCDTAYAFHGGTWWSFDDVLAEVARHRARRVCITGGEPLAQKAVLPLMSALCDAGYELSIETSGALDIAPIDPRVRRVMDLKAPDSGEARRNRWENLPHLRPQDEVKFVLGSRADYDWACEQVDAHGLTARCQVLFSPTAGQLEPRMLADWIVADGREIRFQLQLHKLLWNAEPGR